ncbi:hypothetical protein GCM10010168_04620 [Actinoplanes ianthinogenes]|uniref:Uncharacterized protein n=1 Tax=Actinoplanes ianthinogenes TaxID=122358 RepID=A0ABN6CFG7_9ACTN|nr:hypothetical protein [Actinoplanes ianthinogenes]BCJ42798.1 hypothetical protein Aiant_34550 [Actinoplanes ianthinogenes]GGQ92110.1 hypothetical protein GCM10010168_04620 [Actinoplanes ianthinogenes]
MRINTMLMRSALLPSVCAPSASLPATAAPSALLAAERVLAPQAHQVVVPSQAELGKWAVEQVLAGGIKGSTGTNGTTGFTGNDISSKRYTDGDGAPPRGRPV